MAESYSTAVHPSELWAFPGGLGCLCTPSAGLLGDGSRRRRMPQTPRRLLPPGRDHVIDRATAAAHSRIGSELVFGRISAVLVEGLHADEMLEAARALSSKHGSFLRMGPIESVRGPDPMGA